MACNSKMAGHREGFTWVYKIWPDSSFIFLADNYKSQIIIQDPYLVKSLCPTAPSNLGLSDIEMLNSKSISRKAVNVVRTYMLLLNSDSYSYMVS